MKRFDGNSSFFTCYVSTIQNRSGKYKPENVHTVLASLEDYLHSNPPDYRFQVDSLLKLLYYAFTEYNITESPEFKAKIGPLDRKLRDLAETDEAAEKIIRRTNSADKPGKIIWRANLTALRLNGKMDA